MFTDDDMKRLKERAELLGDEVAMSFMTSKKTSLWPHEMLALLARLEAAEAVCEATKTLKHTEECTDANNCCAEDCFCGYDDVWRSLLIWRKAAGK